MRHAAGCGGDGCGATCQCPNWSKAAVSNRSKAAPYSITSSEDALGVINTVANPDYVTAAASRYRLDLANQAASLDLALDAADSVRAQDSLEKMLVHHSLE